MLVRHSSTTITRAHSAESSVVHRMAELKSRQHELTVEQRQAKSTMTDEESLFKRAQAATEDAVKHAKSSDDTSTTKGKRDRATDLFKQYVYKRVQLASLERKASLSKDGITKRSDDLKQKEQQAEQAIAAKKKALDEIAAAKLKVATLNKNVAAQEVATAKLEVKASEEEKKMIISKVESSKKAQHMASKSLENSQAKARKAEKLASTATKMVKETEDMSLKALLAQASDLGLDDPIKRD